MFRLRAGRRRKSAGTVVVAAVLSFISAMLFRAYAADSFPATFASEVLAPEANVVLPLLRVVCGEGVRTVTAEGGKAFGCGDGSMEEILASRQTPRPYPWMPYVLWQADGVIFGHFLSSTSNDVAINCFACEGHSSLWGGTVLLTKRSGQWKPVWYKAGVITRHCRRVSLASGRQILFCEETDGGMGHRIHGLYVVDFAKPRFAWRTVVLMADTYDGGAMLGAVQTQFIDRVSFEQTGEGELLVRVSARHARVKLRGEWDQVLPTPKLSKYEVDFQLEGDRFRVTPETSAAGRLFGAK